MLSFQALAMATYALARSATLAIAVGLIVFFSGATDFGAAYPVLLLGSPHTYGSAGLSVFVLTAALFGAGRTRAAAFLLGLAPSIHPSLGAWLTMIVAAVAAWDRTWLRFELRRVWPAYLAGFAITLASLALQVTAIPDLPPSGSVEARGYTRAFFAFWDPHRQPIPFNQPAVLLNVIAMTVAGLWLSVFRADVGAARRWLLRFVLVSSIVSLVFAALSWVPVDRLPIQLLVLMPGRMLNVNVVMFAPLVLGLLIMYRHTVWGAAALPILTLLLVVSGNALPFRMDVPDYPAGLTPAISTLNVLLLCAVTLFAGTVWSRGGLSARARPRAGRLITRSAWVVTIGIGTWTAVLLWPLTRSVHLLFRDRTSSAVFMVASERSGLLLTGGDLFLAQLRTRRPLLLSGGGLDGLAYAQESAVAMAGILRDVYGVDLMHPPAQARASGTIPNEVNKAIWEGYSAGRWREVGRKYGVTQVLTYPDWTLDLPVAARDACCVLYDIPD
jgi:hypothetical protein